MGETPGIGGRAAGLWYRVQAVGPSSLGGSAEGDYASVLPAALHAARHRRPFIAGWLSRGGGAPLELITTAGPLPQPGRPGRPVSQAGSDDSGAPEPASSVPAGALSAGALSAGAGAAGAVAAGAGQAREAA